MISKDTISLVRDRTDIVAVVSESVPSLKKHGRRFVGLCPFHQEKTPSFHVNPDSGLYHCFGCKESGDAMRFLERVEGYTFVEAVRALAERAGIAIEEERGAPSDADRHKKEREALYAVMNMAATWYEERLRDHPQRSYAMDELGRRALDPASPVLSAFRVGYAPAGWDGLTNFLKTQGVSPAMAESVGLVVPRSSGSGYYDRFRQRLMFAVVDAHGRVVAFSGRALAPVPGEDATRDPPPKYINSPESPIYTKGAALFGLWQARHAVRREERAILVEGNFDVVSLHARGVDNVVAPLGTAFTIDQAKLLRRYAVAATLLFDGDGAGRKAACAAEAPLNQAGIDGKVATLPDRSDPDEFVRTKGVEALRHVIGQARGYFEYLVDVELDETFNAADVLEKGRRVERIAALLARQTDPVVRGMLKAHVDYVAGRLDLVRSAPDAFGALQRKVAVAARASQIQAAAQLRERASSADPEGRESSSSPRDRAAPLAPDRAPQPWQARVAARRPGQQERKEIVGAILDFLVLLDEPSIHETLELLEGESARIVAALGHCMRLNARGEKVLDSAEFLAQMPPAIQAFASARLAAPVNETIDEARAALSANAKKLRESNATRETIEIVREQHRVVGDWEAELELARHADVLGRQRQGLNRK